MQNQSAGSISGSYLDTLCRNRIRPFQHESGRTPAPLSKRIRIDSVCLLNWFAGRTRLFSAFKKGGFTLNMLAMLVVVLGVTITIILHFTTGTPITTMVGILSGAVTNTPGLGAAQQANSDLNGIDAPKIALGYAVSYPLGVVGIILSLLALKYLLRINTAQEEKEAEVGLGHLQELTVRPISIEVRNESVDGIRIKELRPLLNRKFVISRIKHREGGETELVNSETILHVGDIILVISTPIDVEAITIFFGKEIKWNGNN